MSQTFAANRRGYVWFTGCCLGVFISGGDVQLHCTSVGLYCLGFKKKEAAAAEGLGAPSLISATGTDLQKYVITNVNSLNSKHFV